MSRQSLETLVKRWQPLVCVTSYIINLHEKRNWKFFSFEKMIPVHFGEHVLPTVLNLQS